MHIKTTNVMSNELVHHQLKTEVELCKHSIHRLQYLFVLLLKVMYTIEKGLRTICEDVESCLLLHPSVNV